MSMKLRKINNNIVLGACVIVMMLLCILSISQPIRFDKQRASRETEVKEKLMQTGDFNTLVKGKYLKADAQYIPYSDGKKFSLAATTIVGKSGKQIPLMECGAEYGDYLDGLDEESIQEVTDKANYAGEYPGLKIGDITTDNNNAANW